jgi:hypothetical protein
MDTTVIIIFVIAIAIVAAIAYFYYQGQKREAALRDRFGPEYHRARAREGSKGDAVDELRRRERRVERFQLVDLSQEDQDRFASRWKDVQAAFVDEPAASLNDADILVTEVMVARGYPMSDFEERAADLSVDHANLVANYRAGHNIAIANQRGNADTEDIRQAFLYYRAMFDELLRPAAEPARR